jgi:hypothetical protein
VRARIAERPQLDPASRIFQTRDPAGPTVVVPEGPVMPYLFALEHGAAVKNRLDGDVEGRAPDHLEPQRAPDWHRLEREEGTLVDRDVRLFLRAGLTDRGL